MRRSSSGCEEERLLGFEGSGSRSKSAASAIRTCRVADHEGAGHGVQLTELKKVDEVSALPPGVSQLDVEVYAIGAVVLVLTD